METNSFNFPHQDIETRVEEMLDEWKQKAYSDFNMKIVCKYRTMEERFRKQILREVNENFIIQQLQKAMKTPLS